MASERAKLDRLKVSFQCTAPWHSMRGEGALRFCAECQREVVDFAQSTPQEIGRRLQAGHGRLCGHLTRRGGELVTLRARRPVEPGPGRLERRVPALAAGLVTACLSAAAAGAPAEDPARSVAPRERQVAEREPAPDRHAAPAPGADLHGRITADGLPLPGTLVVARNGLDGQERSTSSDENGDFAFRDLPAGIYDLAGTLAGFSVEAVGSLTLQPGESRRMDLAATVDEGSILTGAVIAAAEPLRRVFAESALVATAVVGPSWVVSRESGLLEVETELRIETLIAGTPGGRTISYRHAEYVDLDDEAWAGDPAPGARVLAFLETSSAQGTVYEAADFGFGIKRLDDDALAAYVRRLEALQGLVRRAARRGEPEPADLAEWLVGTVEEPLTRGEAVGELAGALAALERYAAKAGTTVELAASDLEVVLERFRLDGGRLGEDPRPELVGAALTAAHQHRLGAALRASRGLAAENLALFRLVHAWDEAGARQWLAHELGAAEVRDGEEMWSLLEVAEVLHETALAERILEEARQIDERWLDDDSEESEALRQEGLRRLHRELRQEIAALLASAD